MEMPCDRYKGHDIESLPSDYLKYVAENWNERTERDRKICAAADKEWQWREKNNCHID